MNRSQRLRLSRRLLGVVIAALAVGFFGLATTSGAAPRATLVACPTSPTYPTIQSAVDAAAAGDTVQVCNSTFAEQVLIPGGKNGLTLQAQNALGATIQAPATLPATQSSAIVHVDGATSVRINGFTISGPSTGGCGTIGYGVLVDGGGSATVSTSHITSVRDNPLSGCQNGVGIAAGCCLPTPGASSGSVTADNNTIDNYQKAGIDIRGVGSVGTISNNTIKGAGPTPSIGQNGIQISRGASATVTGNKVSGNAYSPEPLATGILAIGPVGPVTISKNTASANDYGIFVYNVAAGNVVVRANAVTGGDQGINVDLSTGVLFENNVSDASATNGIWAGKDASGNTFTGNIATGVPLPGHDCRDESSGSATSGTANTWTKNAGDTALPDGICSETPIDENVPPVIVLPAKPGTAPPKPAGPPGQEAGDRIITGMRRNKLRTCVIEVRALGPSRVLVARGVAHAPPKGAGRLILRINVKPKGRQLLSKNFGGVTVNVRALCRSTSNVVHRASKSVRAVLSIEHALTPPGSWLPDQPILTGMGQRFMQQLRRRMVAVRFIRCDGYTATWPPSPAFPPTLSLQRARVVCTALKRGGGGKVRVRLVPHGLTDPIATNSTEAGRRVNRRVFVTIVHVRVFRS